MSYLVLARKYRPQTFAEIIGQEHVTRTLVNAIAGDRVAHAILFSGPRGTGKTTAARILAKAMNCAQGPTPEPCNICRSCREITAGSAVDVFEIDGASNNGVDHVRDLRENVKYKPAYSPFKIYIIDEVHMLSTPAFNALLKTLEEPPDHVMFLFATTEPRKIPITILSRCQRHDFRRIAWSDIAAHLDELCRREAVSADEESLAMIAREAGGSMRDALSLLDQVAACTSGKVDIGAVLEILGAVDRSVIYDLADAVFREDFPAILGIIGNVYSRGYNIKALYADLLEHFRNLLVVKMGRQAARVIDLPAHEISRMEEQVREMPVHFLNTAFDVLFNAEAGIKFADQPRLALEMTLLRLLTLKPALPIEYLIEKIDDLRQALPHQVAGADACGLRPVTVGSAGEQVEPAAAVGPTTGDIPAGVGRASNPDLSAAWQRLVKVLAGAHPSLLPHLGVCSLAELSDDRLVVEVNGNSFDGSRLRRKKNLENLKEAVVQVFGRPMRIQIRAGNGGASSIRELKQHENELRDTALRHPLVNEAVQIFNGRVVDVKILEQKEVVHERHGEHAQTGPEAPSQDDENAGGTGRKDG